MAYAWGTGEGPADKQLAGRMLEEVLGAVDGRYLARTFRHVRRRYEVETGLDAGRRAITFAGVGRLAYPREWSSKRGGAPTPHLSSIDGIVLIEEIATRVLQSYLGYHPDRLSARHVRLSAGAQADIALDGVPVRGDIVEVDEQIEVSAQLGGMKIAARFDAPSPSQGADAHVDATTWGGASQQISGEVSATRLGAEWSSRIDAVSLDGVELVAVHVSASHGEALGGAGKALSILDLLRLSAQQAQALIYVRDGIERAAANSIWMRKATFDLGSSMPQTSTDLELRLRIVRDATISKAAHTWRVFDVEAEGPGGVHASASLAYLAGAG